MFEIRHPALRTMAVALTLASAVALAVPASAQSTTTPPATNAAATPAKRLPVDRVEAHITSLHKQLKITAAQQPQWDTLAQIMRDNAQAMTAAIQAQAANVKTASAVDDLKSHEAIADAYSAGMKKFVPAFETLYASMSDAQKKTTDTLFRERQEKHMARAVTKKS